MEYLSFLAHIQVAVAFEIFDLVSLTLKVMLTPRSEDRQASGAFPTTPPPRPRPTCAPSNYGAARFRRTALEAALSGDVSQVQAALEAAPLEQWLPMAKRGGGYLPWLSAAMSQNCSINVLRFLVARGFPLEQTDDIGRTPLHFLYSKPVVGDDNENRQERQHIQYAICLLKAGAAQPPSSARLGNGNEGCGDCIGRYKDSMAASYIKKSMSIEHVGLVIAAFLVQ